MALFPKRRRLILVVSQDLERAIVVDVADGKAPRRVPGLERRAGLHGYVLESALAGVAIKECVVARVNVDVLAVDFREYVAVHHHQTLPAAVLEVQEGATPVYETRVFRQPRSHRN